MNYISSRYKNNIGDFFSVQNQLDFFNKSFAILGCGGQGGYIAEMLTRLGVKELLLFDGDIYEESNLNRQLGALTTTLGENKAEVIAEHCKQINPDINCQPYRVGFGAGMHDAELLINCDGIFCEMDFSLHGNTAKYCLNEALKNNIPIVIGNNHILGSQITLITETQSPLLQRISCEPPEYKIAQPAYLCAITAGLAVQTMIKYLTCQNNCPVNEDLIFDFQHNKVIHIDKYGIY